MGGPPIHFGAFRSGAAKSRPLIFGRSPVASRSVSKILRCVDVSPSESSERMREFSPYSLSVEGEDGRSSLPRPPAATGADNHERMWFCEFPFLSIAVKHYR